MRGRRKENEGKTEDKEEMNEGGKEKKVHLC